MQLFPEFSDSEAKIVNVASVPQRSPFRYPGGKTWLVPKVRHWLSSLPQRPGLFIEPFAGGAITSLTVAAEKLADHVVFVELDADVASVWQTILSQEGADNLAEQILAFHLTLRNVTSLFAEEPATTQQRAFQTIVRNRVNRGGILARGAGLTKHGENGRGIASRWYPKTLARRILAIAALRDRVTFVHGDAFEVIQQYTSTPDTVFFVDPPYTASSKHAGSRLYTHYEIDHQRLFEAMSRVRGDFLMTYDNAAEVLKLTQSFELDSCAVPMKNTHHARMTELLIGRNLGWACG